jgi:hypothetical protein
VTVWEKNVFVYGGSNNDDIAEFNFCDESTVKITKDEAIANACLFAGAPALLRIAQRWAALDGGAWNASRYERECDELFADTRAAIAGAVPQS